MSVSVAWPWLGAALLLHGRRCQVVTGDYVGQPVRPPELDAIAAGEGHQLLEIGWTGGEDLGQLTEEILEAGRADDLDHPGGSLAGVPHGMHLAARLGDVAARTQNDFAVTGSEADLALGDYGVLVFPSMQVGDDQRADGKRVLDDGHSAVGLSAPELELDADAAQPPGGSLAWRND